MEEAARSPFAAWESFYVILGSSAAALTGLQFVVMALVAEARTRSSTQEIAAFGTPTVVHFCAAFLLAAILSAPWQGLSDPSLIVGACGVAGVVYAAIVIRRARLQRGYDPVLEDWLWHTILPLLSYSALAVSALLLPDYSTGALFGIGTTMVVLVVIGIHNAWDTVTFIAIDRLTPPGEPGNDS